MVANQENQPGDWLHPAENGHEEAEDDCLQQTLREKPLRSGEQSCCQGGGTLFLTADEYPASVLRLCDQDPGSAVSLVIWVVSYGCPHPQIWSCHQYEE